MVVVKEVGYADYWGDACEFVKGKWRQVGLTPNPDAPVGQAYVANSLPIDPSLGLWITITGSGIETDSWHIRMR